jgi:adenylate cyclase
VAVIVVCHRQLGKELRLARRLAAILAADVVGYSKLMDRDEAGTLSALKAHRAEVFDPFVAKRGGRVFKLVGDGVFVEFSSIVDAVECALEVQKQLRQIGGDIKLRIGINLGDVILEGDDVYGDGVNVAARLEALAEPGNICLSGVAYDMIVGKVDCEFEDCGLQPLKNISKPVRIYRAQMGSAGIDAAIATGQGESNRQSIAVLPFSNMSGEQDQEYFSDGITEDIITDLSKVSQLFVIARNSTFSYKGRSVKIQQISSDLEAKYIVEGSVRKSSGRVRVTAQLIDGVSGGHIWAERYDRDLTDVFEVQDEITRNIVESLKVAIAPKEKEAIARIPTRNLDAYDCCLRGRQLLHEMNRENLESARKLFAEAVDLDPEYTIAFSGLADCDITIYHYYSSDIAFVEAAINNSKTALSLDPNLAEAHASMGFALFLKQDYAGAERELFCALDLDPMLYEAFWYLGLAKLEQSDVASATEAFSKASRVRGDDLQVSVRCPPPNGAVSG